MELAGYVCIAILTIMVSSTAMAGDSWKFDYGSKEFLKCAQNGKYVKMKIPYRRAWIKQGDGSTHLGLVRGEEQWVNGVICPTDSGRWSSNVYYGRAVRTQYQHDRVKVINTGESEEVKRMLGTHGKYYYWIRDASDEIDATYPDVMHPILQSDWDEIVKGLEYFEKQHHYRYESPIATFLQTTGGWSQYFLNDRVHARSQIENDDFVFADKYQKMMMMKSLYPAEYTVKFFDEIKEAMDQDPKYNF